jgi:hypothetical protein
MTLLEVCCRAPLEEHDLSRLDEQASRSRSMSDWRPSFWMECTSLWPYVFGFSHETHIARYYGDSLNTIYRTGNPIWRGSKGAQLPELEPRVGTNPLATVHFSGRSTLDKPLNSHPIPAEAGMLLPVSSTHKFLTSANLDPPKMRINNG